MLVPGTVGRLEEAQLGDDFKELEVLISDGAGRLEEAKLGGTTKLFWNFIDKIFRLCSS